MQSSSQADVGLAGGLPLVKCRAAEAIAVIDQRILPLETERIASSDAVGRVLAAPAVAVSSVPGFRRAAMDGYAIAFVDVDALTNKSCRQAFQIVGEALPGKPYLGEIKAGECVAIASGAVVPDAVDTIVRWEHVDLSGRQIVVRGAIEARRDVAMPDEDIPEDTVLVQPPRVLRPQDVAACFTAIAS
jgi:molybdopterin molybdotransferase